jgi:hypothetical protein
LIDATGQRRLATSRLLLFAVLAVSTALALVAAVLFQEPSLLGRDKVLTDFDAFYIAGLMADRGQAADAYRTAEMLSAQQSLTGTASFMPWTYLPPYTLVVWVLAQLPIAVSYLLFFAATFVFYLLVLRRVAGEFLPGVLIAILPTIVLLARTGQNGFLTAGLIGCFLLTFTERRAVAGVPLGLMVLKPHLAGGIALLALLGRRWTAMTIAAAIVAAALLVATAAFGMSVWPAFFAGLRDAAKFLADGFYPLFRMSSIYASVLAFGGPAWLALAVHAVGVLVAASLLIYAWSRHWEPRLLAATACVSSLFFSPYNYDYDLTILGLAIAFVLPEILERAGRWELVGLLALSWATTGYGIAANIPIDGEVITRGVSALRTEGVPSLTAPLMILLVISGAMILRREASESAPGLMAARAPGAGLN